jgi:hypothetical protein
MIPKECKRLAEVDFPISGASAHAAREKSIRHGHPSTLHLWWARRPLAPCRAMLLALLLPDPCDEHCPPAFKEKTRGILKSMTGIGEGDDALRTALLGFIGDVANWDVANHPRWIGVARDLVKAAHPEEPPLVVDPFAGGGSIPLEALRLGCEAVASDLNRHRAMAEPFHAFIQNLTVATTGTTRGSAVISLPRSQVEMTHWDYQWQERITKVVRRVAKDLIANDEAEIGEVLRRRLFEDIGPKKTRKAVARSFADWCFERRAQLPPEWTAVDTASTEKKAREYLQKRFEDCYPFNPATISVFQKRVADELTKGVLGGDFDKSDRAEVQTKVADAKEDAEDEVWASYRYVVLADSGEADIGRCR